MKPIDLTKVLKPYKKGWVALDKKNKVVAHASTFKALSDKVKKKKEIWLMPASSNYFGYLTFCRG